MEIHPSTLLMAKQNQLNDKPGVEEWLLLEGASDEGASPTNPVCTLQKANRTSAHAARWKHDIFQHHLRKKTQQRSTDRLLGKR